LSYTYPCQFREVLYALSKWSIQYIVPTSALTESKTLRTHSTAYDRKTKTLAPSMPNLNASLLKAR
jgi:hypothetical protein